MTTTDNYGTKSSLPRARSEERVAEQPGHFTATGFRPESKHADEAAVTEQIRRALVPAVEGGRVHLGGIVATGPTWIEVEHNGRLYLVSITDNGAA